VVQFEIKTAPYRACSMSTFTRMQSTLHMQNSAS
jgi:hypothetical protein